MESVLRDVRTRRFWKLLATQAFAMFGVLAVVGGVVVLFLPDFFVKNGWIAPWALVASGVYGVIRAWPRPIETQYNTLSTTIRLVRGDLFKQEDSHLVIGVSDTFDTASPHIARASVQGQFLEKVYDNDITKLDSDIDAQLASLRPTETIAGKAGKNQRYPLGTTVTLRANALRYFLVAYTLMDEGSTASGVRNELVTGGV